MKLARVVGRVVLSSRDENLGFGNLVVAWPLDKRNYQQDGRGELPKTQVNLVVYDTIGAIPGDIIGYVDGAEATAAFDRPIPIDAYNVGIVEKINYAG